MCASPLLTSLIIANDNFSLFIHDVCSPNTLRSLSIIPKFSKFTRYALYRQIVVFSVLFANGASFLLLFICQHKICAVWTTSWERRGIVCVICQRSHWFCWVAQRRKMGKRREKKNNRRQLNCMPRPTQKSTTIRNLLVIYCCWACSKSRPSLVPVTFLSAPKNCQIIYTIISFGSTAGKMALVNTPTNTTAGENWKQWNKSEIRKKKNEAKTTINCIAHIDGLSKYYHSWRSYSSLFNMRSKFYISPFDVVCCSISR